MFQILLSAGHMALAVTSSVPFWHKWGEHSLKSHPPLTLVGLANQIELTACNVWYKDIEIVNQWMNRQMNQMREC